MHTEHSRRRLLAGTGAVATGLLAGCIGGGERTETEALEREIDVGDAESLAVDTTTGTVEIHGTDREDVFVGGEKAAASQSELDDVALDVRREDGRLELVAEQADGFFVRFGPGPRVDLEIEVPEDLAVESVETTTGRVDVADVAGAVDVDVTTGDVQVSGVEEPITVDATTGDLEVEGPVASLETTTGSIDATIDELAEPAEIDVTTGDVDVTLASDLDVRVVAETTTGSVGFEGEFEEVEYGDDGDDGVAVLGEGETTLTIDTTTGSVTVAAE